MLIWGITVATSVSSTSSPLFQGAPSNKALGLMAVGVVVIGFGLVRLLRRAEA